MRGRSRAYAAARRWGGRVIPVHRWRVRLKTIRWPGLAPILSYLAKWTLRGGLIGAMAGLLAAAFYACLSLSTTWLMGALTGHEPARYAAQPGGFQPATLFTHAWAVPLVCGAGALLGGLVVFWLAPETQGHGTDAAISSIHENPTGTRGRVMLVRMAAAAVTLGSGGSGGSEGPCAQIGAAAGSMLSRRLGLSPADARIVATAGLSAAVAAIFQAPLGGALLGAELLYLQGIAVEMVVPSLIASVAAYTEFKLIYWPGLWMESWSGPMFGTPRTLHLEGLNQLPHLPLYVVLGVVAGLLGRVYIGVFYGTAKVMSGWRLPRALRVGLGGIGAGMVGLGVSHVLGTSYGVIQQVMDHQRVLDPQRVLGMSLLIVLLIPVAKIVATALSIGSGGSGGVFGPGLVIGATAGAALWRLAEPLGLAPASPAGLAIIGAAACLGAAAHAPVAITLIAIEMVGYPLQLALPAAITVTVAVLIVGDRTLYRSQLPQPIVAEPAEPEPEPEQATRPPQPQRASASSHIAVHFNPAADRVGPP